MYRQPLKRRSRRSTTDGKCVKNKEDEEAAVMKTISTSNELIETDMECTIDVHEPSSDSRRNCSLPIDGNIKPNGKGKGIPCLDVAKTMHHMTDPEKVTHDITESAQAGLLGMNDTDIDMTVKKCNERVKSEKLTKLQKKAKTKTGLLREPSCNAKLDSLSSKARIAKLNKGNNLRSTVCNRKRNGHDDADTRKFAGLRYTSMVARYSGHGNHSISKSRIPKPRPAIVGAARRFGDRYIVSRTTTGTVLRHRRDYWRERHVEVRWKYTCLNSLPITYQRAIAKKASKLPLSITMAQRKEKYRLKPNKPHQKKANQTISKSNVDVENATETKFLPEIELHLYKALPHIAGDTGSSHDQGTTRNIPDQNAMMTSQQSAVSRYRRDVPHVAGKRFETPRVDIVKKCSKIPRQLMKDKNEESQRRCGDNIPESFGQDKDATTPHREFAFTGYNVLPSITVTKASRDDVDHANDSSSFNKKFTTSIRAKAATKRVSRDKVTVCNSARVNCSNNGQSMDDSVSETSPTTQSKPSSNGLNSMSTLA